MIVTLINCKDKIISLGVYIDQDGGWDNLRNLVNKKIPTLSSGYDCVNGVLTIEVADGSVIPDLSQFGEVQPDAIT